jgi:general secretion pathway protein G
MSGQQCDKESHDSDANSVGGRTSNRAITVIGLIILGIIIVGLTMLVIFNENRGFYDGSRILTTKASIKQLSSAVSQFKLDTGRYPTDEEGLNALAEKPVNVANWQPGGYLATSALPTDAWGNDFIYKLTPDSLHKFLIISLGEDGKEGGDGDDKDITYDD